MYSHTHLNSQEKVPLKNNYLFNTYPKMLLIIIVSLILNGNMVCKKEQLMCTVEGLLTENHSKGASM